MKAVLQRVSNANVKINGEIHGEILKGLVILLGIDQNDEEAEADFLVQKIHNIRIFCDENDKMNLSLKDIDGEVLIISNFTLCGDCGQGRRPYFGNAAAPKKAEDLYNYFIKKFKETGTKRVESGIFGEDMKLSLLNDGPVTIILDTKDLIKKR